MKTRRKSLLTIGVVIILIALVTTLALCGAPIDSIRRFKPVAEAISLGLDLRGGIYAVYVGDTEAEDFEAQMDATVTIMRTRLTNAGFTEATITRQGSDRIRIEIPDVSDPNAILDIIGTPAHLEFRDPNGNVVIEGKDIKTANAAYNTEDGTPVVQFELNDSGTEAFAKATTEFIGQTIGIYLDDQEISSPTVQTAITTGSGIINQLQDIEYAKTLANLILSGALPLDLTLDEVSAVSATLGVDALERSILAGIIGVALVMLFMIIMYRVPGFMSCLSLCIYILIVLYALALIPGVQLTLPGIAGILLGVGMAVDANVIIFERFREEMKAGRSPESAASRGFHNALSAIIDSNITTIIAGVVLMYFGTGSIKGFAITLTIGIVASMITSVIITRFLMMQAVRLGLKNRKLYAR